MTANFVNHDANVIYLDGNSLGRLPAGAAAELQRTVEVEWGGELIDAWEHWIDEPLRLGDRLATVFLGAEPSSVVLADSTSVNFFKLAAAALDSRPDRRALVTDRHNFPTDRYILEGLALARGLEIRWVDVDPLYGPVASDLAQVLDDEVSLVTFSHVAYRSAAIADMAAINGAARAAGAMNLWDLSHSVGAIPIELAANGVDLAVGCTYKYLNGGPGSPAFLYVAPRLHQQLIQPVWGWFGQQNQFAMGQGYQPQNDIRRFLAGTPPIIALAATRAGIESLARIGMPALRRRSVALTERLIELAEARLFPLGFSLGSPREPELRGGHVLLRHPQARAISVGLRRQEQVIGDFREPDGLRLAPVAAYTTDAEVDEAVDRIHRHVATGAFEEYRDAGNRVT